jgi:hypothetical protein
MAYRGVMQRFEVVFEPDEARRLLTEALALYERIGAGGEGPDKVRAALRRLEEDRSTDETTD